MSMYHAMYGVNPFTKIILNGLDIELSEVPRFRDVWVNRDFTEISIYTRTGGGNRDEFKEENKKLSMHPLYLRDVDDDFDSTYAIFVFKMPDTLRDELLNSISLCDNKGAIVSALTNDAKSKRVAWD